MLVLQQYPEVQLQPAGTNDQWQLTRWVRWIWQDMTILYINSFPHNSTRSLFLSVNIYRVKCYILVP